MNPAPALFGFPATPNAAGLAMKRATLQFAQQICQYEMDILQTALADDDAATQHQKPPRDTAPSPTRPVDLPGNPSFEMINHWVGLTQMMFNGSVQMAMAMHKCALEAMDQLREQTSYVTPAIAGIKPGIPGYMLSALECGMGHTMAILNESQDFAVDSANAVVHEAIQEQVTEGAGKQRSRSRSGARAKNKERLSPNGTAS